jgi:hypothetical protein
MRLDGGKDDLKEDVVCRPSEIVVGNISSKLTSVLNGLLIHLRTQKDIKGLRQHIRINLELVIHIRKTGKHGPLDIPGLRCLVGVRIPC